MSRAYCFFGLRHRWLVGLCERMLLNEVIFRVMMDDDVDAELLMLIAQKVTGTLCTLPRNGSNPHRLYSTEPDAKVIPCLEVCSRSC